MPAVAERLALLLEVHGESFRSAAELCGLDHATLLRIVRGNTESPASLARIAAGFKVPLAWMRGEGDLTTDFMFAVLSRPLQERAMFLWKRERRVAFALNFLHRYRPEAYSPDRLAQTLSLSCSAVQGIMAGSDAPVAAAPLERLCGETGLAMDWFRTGLVGREDEEELLVALATHVLTSVTSAVGIKLTKDEAEADAVNFI